MEEDRASLTTSGMLNNHTIFHIAGPAQMSDLRQLDHSAAPESEGPHDHSPDGPGRLLQQVCLHRGRRRAGGPWPSGLNSIAMYSASLAVGTKDYYYEGKN